MKHLKKYEIFESDSLWKPDEAREALSQIYDIEDEIHKGYVDFLVDIEQFMKYANKYDGYVAGNNFQSLDNFKEDLETKIEGINSLIGSSPIIYIAPFWMTRSTDEIVNFGDVYADTIYVEFDEDIINKIKSDEEYKASIWRDIYEFRTSIKADEIHIFESKGGKHYLRIWWD